MHQSSDERGGAALSAPLIDNLTERDLRRIATNCRLSPPPSDPDDPVWAEAWTHFELIYVPALQRYVYNEVRKLGIGNEAALQDADEIVSEFRCTRLTDGRLSLQGATIRRFRDWLARQARCFMIDWLRKRGAKKRRPGRSFVSADALTAAQAHGPDAAALVSFTEQVATDIVETVLGRVAKRSEPYAHVLRDLIRNGGWQSSDIAERLQVEPRRVADIRRRAREAFRQELVGLVREGLFAEDDVEDLIQALQRIQDDRRG